MSGETDIEQARRAIQLGDRPSAARICGDILGKQADHIEALQLLCGIAEPGEADTVIGYLKRALALDGDAHTVHFLLGDMYATAGDVAAAERAFQVVIDAQPGVAAPWVRLGDAMRRTGHSDEAISAYREAVSIETDSADAWARLGLVFLERGQAGDAMMALRRALKQRANDSETRQALAIALQRLGRGGEAIGVLQEAVRLDPRSASNYERLGDLLLDEGRLVDAGAAYQQAVSGSPELASAHYGAARAEERSGNLEAAAAGYRHALELQPDSADYWLSLLLTRQRLCDWDGVEQMQAQLATGPSAFIVPPLAAVSLGLPAVQQRQIATRFAESLRVEQARPPASVFSMRPIRIGYLSSGLSDDAVGRAAAALIERHDRNQFRVAVFNCGPADKGEVQRRIRRAADEVVDIRFHSPAAAVREIRARGVQVLVDLGGYGRDARPEILAPRVAPLQIGLFGYRGTLGADFEDYLVVDDYLVPEEAAPLYTERLLRMPRGLFVADVPQPAVVAREACDLPDDAFVFCCFDDARKISRQIFDIWMQLLDVMPGSVLWLEERSRDSSARLRDTARQRGIDPQRLRFSAVTDLPSTLGRYAHAHLCLDTYPCSAGTTALHALIAGCPLLTCSGDSYVTRTAGSVLRQLGLDALITSDLGDYLGLAKALSADMPRLAAVRAQLEERLDDAPFTDLQGFTESLERAFDNMLRHGAEGKDA